MSDITGIHHVTAICGDPQENLDFYTGLLGMRLVKKSVNQDAPDTYHLFYADADGNPGTDLTFFPFRHSPPGGWVSDSASRSRWRFPPEVTTTGTTGSRSTAQRSRGPRVRRGDRAIMLTDPHGQFLALVETSDERLHRAWDKSPVPAERQILGLHAVRVWERDRAATAGLLTGVLGFTDFGEEDGWHRYGVEGGGSGKHIEVREMPNEARGTWGVGTMHHVAWRVADDAVELRVRERVAAAQRRPTEVIDRFWFKSVYFLEPGGVLFELATDGPGFTADESLEHLGEQLVLPPWLEANRQEIEASLPPLATALSS